MTELQTCSFQLSPSEEVAISHLKHAIASLMLMVGYHVVYIPTGVSRGGAQGARAPPSGSSSLIIHCLVFTYWLEKCGLTHNIEHILIGREDRWLVI